MSMDEPGNFCSRHIGPDADDQQAMLKLLEVESLDALIEETIPESIRLNRPLNLPNGESEAQTLARMRSIAQMNRICTSYIGMGYHDCVTPPVILRNVMENPSWYTPYTPYQAEIAQGRLESLMNFQTMVMSLTGMEIANASLLDEATAAAEAMTLLYRQRPRRGKSDTNAAPRCLVSDRCFPQVIELLKTRAEPLGIHLEIGPVADMTFEEGTFGALVQYPDDHGAVQDWSDLIQRAHDAGARVAVGSDLLALTLLTPPGEMGADVVYGNAQRFGVPMGYGGPHAAFFATREEFKREIPGRIIGLSVDQHGQPAYRMALQTREQHIRREKATSNICTAQALLANMAAMYAVYHGPEGLTHIAQRIHRLTGALATGLKQLGYTQHNEAYFDTLYLAYDRVDTLRAEALKADLNFRYFGNEAIGLALNETTTLQDVQEILSVFAKVSGKQKASGKQEVPAIALPEKLHLPPSLCRQSDLLTHPVFRTHRSETEMMRYIKQLERKDLGLDTAMIPLGSCTMKLNAAVEMIPVTWPEFGRLHPYIPSDQAEGYHQIIQELEEALCEISGFDAVSLQPNSGAQGEYAGLLAIRAWHRAQGEPQRNVALIPVSAHGTNPASAVMTGMNVVLVQCDDDGYINVDDLKARAEQYRDTLATLMVTYPSTYGIFEERIREICEIVHACGGQVYMDGANLNAQVGLTSPGEIGADVCHINLHKTFAIPHGGGGPGMGPIGVAKHLAPYLPRHPLNALEADGDSQGVGAVSAAPWGSASILLISYTYIRLLGGSGMTLASKVAILNANYIKARLEPYFEVNYSGKRGRVAHELIFDLRPFKESSGITETDVAKRLMDYGFHAPTVSWPVPGTMMVEPTESESKFELDRFCDAMISIHSEMQAIADGQADPKDNVLHNAPHTAAHVTADEWYHPYSRSQAAYPVESLRANKFWPAVGRVDNTYGDRNLVCACPSVTDYAEE